VEYFEYGIDDPNNFDIEQFLQRSQKLEKQRLESEIQKVEEQLEERDQIFEEHRSDLESKVSEYLEKLEDAYRVSGDINNLKQVIGDLYESLHQEKVKHWRDRQELERERRELWSDLRELEEEDILDLF
jgi:trichohyalin